MEEDYLDADHASNNQEINQADTPSEPANAPRADVARKQQQECSYVHSCANVDRRCQVNDIALAWV